jgi:hypothetical protein
MRTVIPLTRPFSLYKNSVPKPRRDVIYPKHEYLRRHNFIAEGFGPEAPKGRDIIARGKALGLKYSFQFSPERAI